MSYHDAKIAHCNQFLSQTQIEQEADMLSSGALGYEEIKYRKSKPTNIEPSSCLGNIFSGCISTVYLQGVTILSL